MHRQDKYTTVSEKMLSIRGDIQTQLGVKRFKPNGFSTRNIRCPFHEDREPSASLHQEKGLYCHAEGEWYSWKKLAGKLGVEWRFSGTRQTRYLTDEVIQKLVQRRRVRAVQVLAELYEQGYEGQVMSIGDVVNIAGCSRETVDRMSFSAYLPTYNYKEGGKQPEKPQGGRPKKFVRVPTLSELEELLGCDASKRRYTLEVSDDGADLKAHVVSLPITRAPNKTAQLPTRYLAKSAGMTPKTTRKYLKRVNEITPDVTGRALTIGELAAMPESHREYKSTREQGWTWLAVGDRQFAYSKPQAMLAIHLAGNLESVRVYTRRANTYKYTGKWAMPEPEATLLDLLKSALRLRGAGQPHKSEWEMLMDDMDNTIQEQEATRKNWEWKQLEWRQHEPTLQHFHLPHVQEYSLFNTAA